MAPKKVATVGKTMSDLGLVEKLIKDAEEVLRTIEEDFVHGPKFERSLEFMNLLRGQLTMAKFMRRMLSTIVKEDAAK